MSLLGAVYYFACYRLAADFPFSVPRMPFNTNDLIAFYNRAQKFILERGKGSPVVMTQNQLESLWKRGNQADMMWLDSGEVVLLFTELHNFLQHVRETLACHVFIIYNCIVD